MSWANTIIILQKATYFQVCCEAHWVGNFRALDQIIHRCLIFVQLLTLGQNQKSVILWLPTLPKKRYKKSPLNGVSEQNFGTKMNHLLRDLLPKINWILDKKWQSVISGDHLIYRFSLLRNTIHSISREITMCNHNLSTVITLILLSNICSMI